MLVKRGICNKCGWICCQGCDQLDANGLCKIWSSKPNGCTIYPHNPMALEKGCTYYFVENGDVITAENLLSYPEERRVKWLEACIEKSVDE